MVNLREKLLSWTLPDTEHTFTTRDTILYALGVGLGADPLDARQLRFVYEQGLQVLPTMPVVLGYPGFWWSDPRLGIDWKQLLHGEQGGTIHQPLPAEGSVIGRTRIIDVVDKGADKGAFVYSRREVTCAKTGALLCTLTATTVLRGDGGFGGPAGTARASHPIPAREPDCRCDLQTLPQSALLYRLSGDYNPLHADPAVAASAGFARPILHGLCTFGVAGHALLKALCDYRPERLTAMNARFSAPVYPGETIRTEMWVDGSVVSFRASVVERGVIVLNNGQATVDL